jgi:hypothetical protein
MVEPSELIVPVKVNFWLPATAVRVTLWPLAVPLTVADPALHTVFDDGSVTE